MKNSKKKELRGDLLVHVKHKAYDIVDGMKYDWAVQRVGRCTDFTLIHLWATWPFHSPKQRIENSQFSCVTLTARQMKWLFVWNWIWSACNIPWLSPLGYLNFHWSTVFTFTLCIWVYRLVEPKKNSLGLRLFSSLNFFFL